MLLPYAKYRAMPFSSLSFAVDSSHCRRVERSSADEDVALTAARLRYDHTRSTRLLLLLVLQVAAWSAVLLAS